MTTTENFAGHTPGKWRAVQQAKNSPPVIRDQQNEAIAYAFHGGGRGHDEAEANARLIAAAPTLLAERDAARAECERLRKALQMAIRWADAHGDTVGHHEISEARAALGGVA